MWKDIVIGVLVVLLVLGNAMVFVNEEKYPSTFNILWDGFRDNTTAMVIVTIAAVVLGVLVWWASSSIKTESYDEEY